MQPNSLIEQQQQHTHTQNQISNELLYPQHHNQMYHVSGERVKSRRPIENRSTGTAASFKENLIEPITETTSFPDSRKEKRRQSSNLVIEIIRGDLERAEAPPVTESP